MKKRILTLTLTVVIGLSSIFGSLGTIQVYGETLNNIVTETDLVYDNLYEYESRLAPVVMKSLLAAAQHILGPSARLISGTTYGVIGGGSITFRVGTTVGTWVGSTAERVFTFIIR